MKKKDVVTEYAIYVRKSSDDLCDAINNALQNEGKQPYGFPFMTPDGQFAQAMIGRCWEDLED